MKLDEIAQGTYQVGTFEISIQPAHFDMHEDFFHVMVHEMRDGFNFYCHLVDDARFGHFTHLSNYSRKLNTEDMIEYNHHVSSVFHKILMPTFYLSRHSIVNLFDVCQSLAKKIKKQSQMAKRQEINHA